jgi:hypothetical protein
MQIALERTAEILYGCLIAYVLGMVMTGARKWLENRYYPEKKNNDTMDT